MDLLFHEFTHLFLSLLVGLLLYRHYKIRSLISLSLFVGIFLDLDHLIDYFLAVEFSRFNLIDFLDTRSYFQEAGKMFIFFHGWEYVLGFLFLSGVIKKYRPWLLTIALAMLGHLVIDQFSFWSLTDQWILGYLIFWRWGNGFNHDAFLDSL